MKKLEAILNYLLKTAKQTASMVGKEVPLLFKEVVRLQIVEHGTVTGAYVLAAIVVWVVTKFIASAYQAPFAFIPGVAVALVLLSNALESTRWVLKALCAPRVVVLEYVTDKLRDL